MFESSVTSPADILASMSKDTGLFLFFNLMILSILLSSLLNLHRDHHNQQDLLYPQSLQRAPSILQRLISLSFYSNLKPHEEHPDNHYPQSHYADLVHEPQHNDKSPNQFVRSSSILQTLMSSLNLFSHNNHYPQSHCTDGAHDHEPQHNEENPNQFVRSSSILQTLMSSIFNAKTQLSYSNTNQPNPSHNGNFEQNYYNRDQTQELGRSNNIIEDEHEEEDEEAGDEPTLDEIYRRITDQKNNNFRRLNPNPKPEERPIFNNAVPVNRLRKTTSMRVSSSSSPKCEDKESIENRRPASMRERSRMRISDIDEEINEKATDFINRFKQQLRLQRMESIKKYKNMIARGIRR